MSTATGTQSDASRPVAASRPVVAAGRPAAGGRVWRFARRASVVAAAVSVVVHVALLVLSGVIRIGLGDDSAARGARAGTVQVAVIDELELRAIEQAQVVAATPEVHTTLDSSVPIDATITTVGGSGSQSVGDIGALGDGLGGSGLGEGVDIGQGLGGSGAGGTQFFNVPAIGNRFVYVVDVSGSMAEGEKLALLKEELIESISSLPEGALFSVFTFQSDYQALLSNERWYQADEPNKRAAVRAVRALEAAGGTVPGGALTAGFVLKPRPHAVYFLTDGLFDAGVVAQVAGLNARSEPVPVHCITLVSKEAQDLMRQIARDSGGTYRHVDGVRLP